MQINFNNKRQNNLNERRNTNPNQITTTNSNSNSIVSPPSEKKLINNYFSEKNESGKTKGCVCQIRPEEALIKNGVCRLCNRNVKSNYNSHQNQFNNPFGNNDNNQKKPNTLDYNSNPLLQKKTK